MTLLTLAGTEFHLTTILPGYQTLTPINDPAWFLNRMANQFGTEHSTLHFVGFKDDRYLTALKYFGKPDFIHRHWDRRAIAEVMPGDVVVFASGDETQAVGEFTFNDSANW
jgi:hypothetical protein